MSAERFQHVRSNQTGKIDLDCETGRVAISCLLPDNTTCIPVNICETLRSEFEKWISITNVLLRFRQKRWGRGVTGLSMSQVAPILLSSADRRWPTGDRTKKQKQQSLLSSFVHSQTGMFSNLIYTIMFAFYAGGRKKPADCSQR